MRPQEEPDGATSYAVYDHAGEFRDRFATEAFAQSAAWGFAAGTRSRANARTLPQGWWPGIGGSGSTTYTVVHDATGAARVSSADLQAATRAAWEVAVEDERERLEATSAELARPVPGQVVEESTQDHATEAASDEWTHGWLNEDGIEEVLEQFAGRAETPNLARMATVVENLKNWTNQNSDGWPYWSQPSRAAGRLMGHLYRANLAGWRYEPVKDVSEDELEASLRPIRAFLNKRDADWLAVLGPAAAKPDTAQSRARAVPDDGDALLGLDLAPMEGIEAAAESEWGQEHLVVAAVGGPLQQSASTASAPPTPVTPANLEPSATRIWNIEERPGGTFEASSDDGVVFDYLGWEAAANFVRERLERHHEFATKGTRYDLGLPLTPLVVDKTVPAASTAAVADETLLAVPALAAPPPVRDTIRGDLRAEERPKGGPVRVGTLGIEHLLTNHRSMVEVISSLRVSETPDAPVELCRVEGRDDLFEIVDGHHRLARRLRNGETTVPVWITDDYDDEPYQGPFYDFAALSGVPVAPPHPPTPVPRFRPTSRGDLAPGTTHAKLVANLDVLEVLARLDAENRPPTSDEQAQLARWSAWGALQEVVGDNPSPDAQVQRVRELLDGRALNAAARTTLTAYYTDGAIVEAIWSALTGPAAGGGTGIRNVLEPGCGAGSFIGFAPDRPEAPLAITGVELDPTTARVAQLLYPDATIRAESFVDTRLPEGSQDLVVGNVPFAQVTPHDKVYNSEQLSLHNYFIYKSLRLVRPGGVVALLTSRYTMDADAKGAKARAMFGELADLVSAIRLPSGAFKEVAGTEVVTDLLVFRRRTDEDAAAGLAGWQHLAPVSGIVSGEPATVVANSVFTDDPGRVLGVMGVSSGQYGPVINVRGGTFDVPAVANRLKTVLEADIAEYAKGRPFITTPPAPAAAVVTPGTGPAAVGAAQARTTAPRRVESVASALTLPPSVVDEEGHISINPAGGFLIIKGGVPSEHPVAKDKKLQRELRELLGLRDTVVVLLDLEASTAGEASPEVDERMTALRARLNRQYDAYVASFGPINRVSRRESSTRVDEVTGEPVVTYVRPKQGDFREDPYAQAVYALEEYDAESNTAKKAAIFRTRIIAPRQVREQADSPADAVALCLDTFGMLRVDEVARLLGVDEEQAAGELEAFAYLDPATALTSGPRWLPRDEYLSGNVRARLKQVGALLEQLDANPATDAAGAEAQETMRRRLEAGRRALEEVQPDDLGPAEISVQLGAPWVPVDVVQQFLRETFEDPYLIVENPGGSIWAVKGNRKTVAARSVWGTDRKSAPEIAQYLLQQETITVFDYPDGETRVKNQDETEAAREKAEALQERFGEWIWEEPERCAAMVRIYNDTFNALVSRHYEVDENKTYPGLALTIGDIPLKLRPHQHVAIARMIAQPTVLLAHEVGAGKTLEAIVGVMEMKRLQLINKPMIVVPNHLVEQFGREWVQAYPMAKVLTCDSSDLEKEKRRLFVARAATGEWDAVIISMSAFEKIPVSREAELDYADAQVEELRRRLANAENGSGLTTKRVQAALAREEERVKRLRDVPRDPAITFEATGTDYLVVDEAHLFKNRRVVTNIDGQGKEGAKRATDLDLKMNVLRARYGGRAGTFMTATPVANSISEVHIMLSYLAPDLWRAAGVEDFDTWAATFGKTVASFEQTAGGAWKSVTRFAKFVNVPELLAIWHQVVDVKTAEDLGLPTPEVITQEVVVPETDAMRTFMAGIRARAERVGPGGVPPEEDNMLKIVTDARLAAVDLRLAERGINGESGFLDREPGKLDYVAAQIAKTYHETVDLRFGDDVLPGGLQMVFLDKGTPGGAAWNAYEEIKAQAVERGVPASKIRFIHDAKGKTAATARLFEQCRTGEVAVLIGSTEKMGVGTNVQRRMVELHDVDVPWRPADIAQRRGRGVRQGNLNPAIRLTRYLAAGSFDVYSWQTVERKAKFIGQVMTGSLNVREIEDIGEDTMSYGRFKAMASGDDRIMELAKSTEDVVKLERLARSWNAAQGALRSIVRTAEQDLERFAAVQTQAQAALPHVVPTDGEAFSMTIGATHYGKRADAAPALARAITAVEPWQRTAVPIGRVGGLDLEVLAQRWQDDVRYFVRLTAVPSVSAEMMRADVNHPDVGLVTRVENLPRRVERRLEEVTRDIERTRREQEKAASQLADEFPRADELSAARTRRDELQAELEAEAKNQENPSAESTDETSVAPRPRAALAPTSTPVRNRDEDQQRHSPARPYDNP